MHERKTRKTWTTVIVLLILAGAALASTQTAWITTNVSTHADQAFRVGARAHGSGGIIMQGRTTFVLVVNGKRSTLPPSQVKLAAEASDRLCVQHETSCYVLPLEHEFAKPMIRWVLRGDETAFSNTEGRSAASQQMRGYGLVRRSNFMGHFIARELDTDRLFTLLREADYAKRSGVVESLPAALVSEIKAKFNRRLSSPIPSGRLVHRTWTNADYNTKFTTELRDKTAVTTGRPLRYYWAEYEGETALKITDIDAYRQSGNSVVREIVQLYQAAAVLRTIADVDRTQLADAVAALGGTD